MANENINVSIVSRDESCYLESNQETKFNAVTGQTGQD